jgi:hypothetical protein
MRKPHFREREGKKVTNRPRTVGLPVSFAHRYNFIVSPVGRAKAYRRLRPWVRFPKMS